MAPARELGVISIPPNLSIDVCVAEGMDRETLIASGPLSQRELEDIYVDFIETRNRQLATVAELRRVEDAYSGSDKERENRAAEEEAAMWEAVRAGRERDRETARAQEAEAARWAALTPTEREEESKTIEQRDALFRHLFIEAAAVNTEAAWNEASKKAHDILAYWNRIGSEVAAGRTSLKQEEIEIQKNLWDQKIKLADTMATALSEDRPGWKLSWQKERAHAKKVFPKATDVWLNFSITMRNFNNEQSELPREVRFAAVREAAGVAAKATQAAAEAASKVAKFATSAAYIFLEGSTVASVALTGGAVAVVGFIGFAVMHAFDIPPPTFAPVISAANAARAAANTTHSAACAILSNDSLTVANTARDAASFNAVINTPFLPGIIDDSTWSETIAWSLQATQEVLDFVSTPAFADAAAEFRAEQARRAPSAAVSSESTPSESTQLRPGSER